MQLVGRLFDDRLLLRVAYAYQHSVDWESLIRVRHQQRRVAGVGDAAHVGSPRGQVSSE
jgi:hypothetical protein